MAYATQEDLETRFGADEIAQISDRALTGFADGEAIAAALMDAAFEVDGYLAARYALPLETVPPLVTRLACDVARYRLWKDRASEQVRRGYEDAVAALKRIASGQIKLPIASGAEPATAAGATPGSRQAAFTAAVFEMMP